jgi:soluble lytic murein transglycosylase-like protein
VEYDQLRGEIAKGYLDADEMGNARDLAQASIDRSGANAPDAGWIGGLVAWRQGDFDKAAKLFGQVAVSPYATSWMAAAGAYWASRAEMRAGHIDEVRPMLEKAAAFPRTFYGLLATRALGWDFDFDWTMPRYTGAHRAKLSHLSAFGRAAALAQVGQFHLAGAELLAIDPGGDRVLREALIAYASHAGLPSLAMRLAQAYTRPGGGLYDAALYPVSPWKPADGYVVDEALMQALIRQESRFDPEAQSGNGAIGLMQLMPATASFVSGSTYEADLTGRHALKDPQVNLDIGQRYVKSLLYTDTVGADLLSLLVAYNAGPGALSRWKQQYSDTMNDPLLFIETIPLAQTRAYVEHVMANYWIYRMRLGKPAQSLDQVAEGHWAPYPGEEAKRETASIGGAAVDVASAINP